MDKLTEELEIAKLQEERARALPISEKEREIALEQGVVGQAQIFGVFLQYPFRVIPLRKSRGG